MVHLGTAMYMLGAVLYIMCFHALDGTACDSMHARWTCISGVYKDYNVVTRHTNLKLGSCDEPLIFHKLKGKGAEVKDLVASFAHVRKKYSRASNDDRHKWLSIMLDKQLIPLQILHDHNDPTCV